MECDDLALPWDEGERGFETDKGRREAETVLTVSEVNRMARLRLEELSVLVHGEVSRLATGYAYYVYFDLRDEEASLPAILPRGQFKSLGFPLEEGCSVVVRGTLTLYERQGRYQIRVVEIRPFGEGELQRRIEALKKKLLAEGLFDEARKKPLPRFPGRIGVVTSPRGAAVRDVVVTLRRRFPPARVYLRGVSVQGTGSVNQICDALDFFERRMAVDLVILARGGGSLQDLEPFNSEEVARAISRMSVPVITGVGHEPDVTIADLVADHRASTPTGAAEAAVPERQEVRALLAGSLTVLTRRVEGEIRAATVRLAGHRRRPLYRSWHYLLGPFMQRWERAAGALPGSPKRGLLKNAHRLALVMGRPVYRRSEFLTAPHRAAHGRAAEALRTGAIRWIEKRRHGLERLKTSLEALSPLAVLERGYSITFNRETGAVLRGPDEVDVGTPLRITLARGGLEADVTGKE